MFTDICGSVYTQIIQHFLIADPLLSGFALLTGQFIHCIQCQFIPLDYCSVFLWYSYVTSGPHPWILCLNIPTEHRPFSLAGSGSPISNLKGDIGAFSELTLLKGSIYLIAKTDHWRQPCIKEIPALPDPWDVSSCGISVSCSALPTQSREGLWAVALWN